MLNPHGIPLWCIWTCGKISKHVEILLGIIVMNFRHWIPGYPKSLLSMLKSANSSILSRTPQNSQRSWLSTHHFPGVIVYDPFLPHGLVAAHVLGIPAVSTVTHPGPGTMPHPPQLRLDLQATKGERMGIYITNKIGDLTNRMNHQNIGI